MSESRWQSTRDPIAGRLPRELYAEVTNRCNSRCETCVRTFRKPEPLRDLRLSEFQAIVDQFPALERVVLHGIGEPLLNAELAAMVGYIKAQHPSATILFNSNAVLLDDAWQASLIDAGLDEYRISLDAASAALYAAIRGIDAFDTVVDNVRRFVARSAAAGHPRLSIWLTALRENLGELPDIVDLAAEIGVREVYVQRLVIVRDGLAQAEHSVYGRLRKQEEAALAESARRAEAHGLDFRASGLVSPAQSLRGETDGAAQAQAAQLKPCVACARLWRTTYVTANGNVLPCCISPFSTTDYEGLILGNVFRTPFAQIWNDTPYVDRRAALYTSQPLHPCELCGVHWSL